MPSALLSATLGNLTELVIAVARCRRAQYMLVRHPRRRIVPIRFSCWDVVPAQRAQTPTQEFNRANARCTGPAVSRDHRADRAVGAERIDTASGAVFTRQLSAGLSVMLIAGYALGLVFSLKTHRDLFAASESEESAEAVWPIGLAVGTLVVVTVLVALVSEVFVASVQEAAVSFGMTPAFVGFIVVALVGAAAEMASAFSAARKNRLDLSVGIALGSASQIALFVAPVLVLLSYFVGPTPMDLQFWPGAVLMTLIAALTAFMVTSTGRSAWFVGVLVLMVYFVFAMTLYLMPPAAR